MSFDEKRVEELIKLGESLKEREFKMRDIRDRDWLNLNTRMSKLLRLLIEAEDILSELDDYQMRNDQCYPDFEELYNQLAFIRRNFTNYVDENKELLTIDKKINDFYKNK